jgi:hypothetical protein
MRKKFKNLDSSCNEKCSRERQKLQKEFQKRSVKRTVNSRDAGRFRLKKICRRLLKSSNVTPNSSIKEVYNIKR